MELLRKHPRLSALALSLVLHALLVGLLYWLVLSPQQRPHKPNEVVLIDLGDVAQAQGEEEPQGEEANSSESEVATAPEPRPEPEPKVEPKPVAPKPQPQPTAKPKPTPPKAEPINTQRHEESLKMREEEARKRQEAEAQRRREAIERQKQAEAERQARAEAEARAKAEREAKEAAERQARAKNSVAAAFGAGRNKSGNQGNATGQGNQGDTAGSAGGSFSLEGRRIVSNGGRLTSPRVNKAIEGRIVVQIEVDASGRVTSANVSPRGTTIADPAVRSEALKAAKTTNFNPQEGATSQKGSITYIYVLKD